jgi:hypothetical protein
VSDEIEMPATYVGQGEDWHHFKAGAHKVATQRLSDLHQIIVGTVFQFYRDASEQVESFDGESQSGLGASLFSSLTSVLFAAIPNPAMGVAAIVAFRDVLVSGISAYASSATDDRHKAAREQLRHVVNELATSTQESANSAWSTATGRIDGDLDLLWQNRKDHYGPIRYGDDASWWEGQICDEIGVRDPHVYSPAADITRALWAAWTPEVARVSLRVQWEDKSHTGKLQYLLENPEHFDHIMSTLGLDASWWRIALEQYVSGNTGGPSMRQ